MRVFTFTGEIRNGKTITLFTPRQRSPDVALASTYWILVWERSIKAYFA